MGIFNFGKSAKAPKEPEEPEGFDLSALTGDPADTNVATEMTPAREEPPRADLAAAPPPPPAPTTTHDPINVDPLKTLELKPKLIEALSTVYDPEIPVNIYEMGLIYDIDVDADGLVGVRMTLTSPGCPAAQSLPGEVKAKAKSVPGVSDAWVDVVWDPTWEMSKMSDAAKLQLGLL